MRVDYPIVDAHQHFWDVDQPDYAWLEREPDAIRRTFGFDDLRPHLQASGVGRTVLVQAADTASDTDAMLRLADAHPQIAGVVAYVPLEQPAVAEPQLAELMHTGRVCGIRNLIHDQPDPDWLRRPDVADGLALLEARDVPFDLVAVLPRHLEYAQYLSERFPDLRIVIDHLAKPPVGTDRREPWQVLMRAAAENPNVYAKVSGLYPVPGAGSAATAEQLRPWLDTALSLFGPDRLMFGSDWPVAVAYGDYEQVVGTLVELVTGYGADVARAILADTATGFYRLTPERQAGR